MIKNMLFRWTEPLDLQTILINTFAGSIEIFTFIAFIAIGALAAMFRMRNSVTLLMFVMFAIIMASFIGQGYVIISILIAGLVVYYLVARIVK